uniref:Cyclin-like domain-containing protein n=1 Tax=Leersia perrieri TaxID=77586 RepID=A0A0D9VGK6_9ORYZ
MDGESQSINKLSCHYMYSWYFTREELEKLSPSRKDGITESMESEIRQLYCSFIRDVGIRLKLPQMTIATAIMFCHRFYLHQSLAKNGWQVIRVAYGTMYRKDPATARRIHQKDVFEKQKALILTGERLVLATVRFDFNIQHPYKPLLDAMEKLGITQKEVKQVAWNFVNDWLKTTLCLQYKPQYIAAGSLYLAAKLHNVKLPVHGAHVWWHQFDVAPKPLEAVLQQMREMVHMKGKLFALPSPVKQKEAPLEGMLLISSSPDSVLTRSSLSVSSSSPEINDRLHVDSSQDIVSMHIEDGGKLHPERCLSNLIADRNNPSKAHNKENLGQASKIKQGDAVISCDQQVPLDAIAEVGKCMVQNVSICTISSNTFNGKSLNQVSISPQGGDRANLCSEGGWHTDVDSKSTQSVEPPTTNCNHCSDSLNVDSSCSDRTVAASTVGTMEKASSVLPVQMKVDHLRVQRKKVDVARIKDLLMRRKRQRERQEQPIPSVDLSEEAWIERELESGIVIQKADHVVASDDLSDEDWIERELESGIVIGQTNEKPLALDGLSEDDWIERELESGIIVESGPAGKKLKSSFC